MGLKEIKNTIFPPCKKCPYQLGLVNTLISPCPECKKSNYASYNRYIKMDHKVPGEEMDKEE